MPPEKKHPTICSLLFCSKKRFLFVAVALLFVLALCPPARTTEHGRSPDASWQRTYDAYSYVPCLTEKELAYGAEVILGLDYNSRRIFRQFCRMNGIDFVRSKQVWALLVELDLSYEQVLSFEQWSLIEGVDSEMALAALQEVQTLSYEASKSFRQYCLLPWVTPLHAIKTIPLLNRLDAIQNKAVQNLIAIRGVNARYALRGLGNIARMGRNQAWAAAAFAMLPEVRIEMIGDALPLIGLLNDDDGWNAKTLFQSDAMTAEEAWYWLIAYFANPTDIQEQQFQTLSDKRKNTLLHAFYRGGEEIIWKINNLHAITDRFGFEISNQELTTYAAEQLQDRFEMLSPQVRSRFGNRFYQNGSPATKKAVLKEATAADRVETARQLTSANIYALLAQGSELYDSSFRNILVPVLQNYIETAFNNDLLDFLNATDPENRLVSNFIVSLAQKGKLTLFFPADPIVQQKVLDLVAQSAFKDEDSIILFSATFMYLLEVLEPSARTFLITRMSQQADAGTVAYSRLITVILQYYMQEFPEILGPEDKTVITRLVVRHGAVNLHKYLATPFQEWKEDHTLHSISVFHPDDDGRGSFLSNARTLLKSGYRLALSNQFTVSPLDSQIREAVHSLIQKSSAQPDRWLPVLFSSMQRRHYAVALERIVNGITIRHDSFIYSDETKQEILLERFIRSGTEMFAQRGHSYWRSEQITDPLTRLLEEGRLAEHDLKNKQRFLSLGSCGGVKAYTRLNEMFLGHVDILATIGTGLAAINDPYNKHFFEVIARNPSTISWKDLDVELAFIFRGGQGKDYLQPASLPAILHKILDEEKAVRENTNNRNTNPLSISTIQEHTR